MSSLEDMKNDLAKKVIEVMDLCDAIMKEENHIGVLEITTMLFIAGLYRATGRPVSNTGDMLNREELVYPLPPLVIGEGKGPGITVETVVEETTVEETTAVESVVESTGVLEPQPLERH